MKPIASIYFLLLLLLSAISINAQRAPLDFNLIKGANGITLGKINGITQDRLGYMWFADANNHRIIRFDGYRMKAYEYDPADSNSLDSKSGVECIAADSSGYIWVNAATGVDKFDPATNKFIHYHYRSNEIRGVNAILINHLGIVWLGTDGGLVRLDQKTGRFIFYRHRDNDITSLSCDTVHCLYEDREGVLWVGTGSEFYENIKEGGLNRFNRETGTFTRYMHDPNNPKSLAGDKVRAIFEDSRGVFWVGTDGDGLHIMDRKNGTFERLTYDPTHPEKLSRPPLKKGNWTDHITFINEDGAGKIWIGTWNAGLVRYDPDTKEITHYDSSDKTRPKGFTEDNGWCAYTSRDGVMWFSTDGADHGENKLFRIDPLQTGISSVNMGDEVTNIYSDSSRIVWMCFRNNKGLLRIGPNKDDKKYFKHDPSDPYSISSNEVTFFLPNSDGFYWVGTLNGLNRFDSKTGRFTRYFYNEISKGDFKDTAVFNLLKGNHGEIYLSTIGAFVILNPQTGLIERYVNNLEDTASINANFVTGKLMDKSGNLWIGTWSNAGLNYFDIRTKKFKHYLIGMNIESIFNDTTGTLWVGTNHGLYYRNDSTDSFIAVDEWKKEFRNAQVQLQFEDNQGNMWGNSSLGIFRYNPQKHELSFYGKKFGINDTSTFFRNQSITPDGRLAFSKGDGYYSLSPKDVINDVPAQIILTGFKMNGRSVNPGKDAPYEGALEEAKEIKLNYNQNNFSIDFAAIHYSSPEDNIHYYMLEGYDEKWIKPDSLKMADYRNLPTGKYTFKIKAASSYGVWSEKEVVIIISPPWWLTWWAYVLYAVLFLIILWGSIKWWTRKLEKDKKILEEKVTQRTKELREEKELVESTLSELKSTQALLIQSEKMASLGELTAGIAHEIQNPLNFMNNFSEVNKELLIEMKDEIGKGNTDQAITLANDVISNEEKINHHGKRADGIVKGMLQHSRSSTGVKEPADINALCDEYLRLAYHGLRAKDKSFNAIIKTDFDETAGKVNMIPQDIGRVILNVINNAFYAVAERKKQQLENYEPTVSVSTNKFGDKVSIIVMDNGNGIPQKVIDKIFQPFFTTKPTGQGTGLGLSLSYDVVKAHGGEINAETKEGEGTTFIIQLPVA